MKLTKISKFRPVLFKHLSKCPCLIIRDVMGFSSRLCLNRTNYSKQGPLTVLHSDFLVLIPTRMLNEEVVCGDTDPYRYIQRETRPSRVEEDGFYIICHQFPAINNQLIEAFTLNRNI